MSHPSVRLAGSVEYTRPLVDLNNSGPQTRVRRDGSKPDAKWGRKPDGFEVEPDAGLSRFLRMRIPDERLNLVMLAVVTLFTAGIATGAAFMQRPAAAQKPVYLADQTPVRVVGPAFVPNTNPRDR